MATQCRRELHWRVGIAEELPGVVSDAYAVDLQVEAGCAAQIDQCERGGVRAVRCFSDCGVQNRAASGLDGAHRPPISGGDHSVGLNDYGVDRRVGGRVNVTRGKGRGQRGAVSSEGEVMEGGDDQRRSSVAGRNCLRMRSACADWVRARAIRACSGDVLSDSANRTYSWARLPSCKRGHRDSLNPRPTFIAERPAGDQPKPVS